MALAGVVSGQALAATSSCPGARASVRENLFSADCAGCWAATGPATNGWRWDWITPGSASAPLAAGALPESAERALRLGLPALPADQAQVHTRATLPALPGLRLHMVSGPAWQGYFGLEMRLRSSGKSPLPKGSSAWLALVELVPAGSDGSPVARALVRSVAGPLPLDALNALQPGQPMTHLRALRWPASAEPTRLQARGWIEGPDGTILATAADRCR